VSGGGTPRAQVVRGPNGGESFGRGARYARNQARRANWRRKGSGGGSGRLVVSDEALKSLAADVRLPVGSGGSRFSEEVQRAKEAAMVREFQLRELRASKSIQRVAVPGGGGKASTVVSGCSSVVSEVNPGSSVSCGKYGGSDSGASTCCVSETRLQVLEGTLEGVVNLVSSLSCGASGGVVAGGAKVSGQASRYGDGCNDVCFDDEY